MSLTKVIHRNYRPDIDGLRTVAVIPVILFHAGFLSFYGIPLASGGFVGVDIFFVISGYLISGVIYSEINSKSYSVFSFYARRVRRIFPALFVVYLVCLAWGMFRGIFNDIEEIRNAVVSSVLFVSNMYFSANAGYFDGAIQSNPLLHTWSLSIEEQFYIILPLIFLALRPLSHKIRIATLSALVICSLSASIYLSRVYPDIAYYSFVVRAWELGIGGLLAITGLRIHTKVVAEVLGLAGASAIVISIVTFDQRTEFPSYTALLPTLGAAAVILSGSFGQTLVSRFLSLGPMRWVGLISYSLYLWHWPILVISRLEGFNGRKSALAAIVLCFVLSWISWRYVEQPFRITGNKVSPKRTVAAGAIAMAATVVLALWSIQLNAILLPINDQARAIAAFDPKQSQNAMRPGICFLTSQFNSLSYYQQDQCLKIDPVRPNVLLVGDSHSAQYAEALRVANPNANIMQASASGCLPLIKTVGEKRCTDLWNFVTQEFLPKNVVDAVVIVGRWQAGTSAEAFETARLMLNFTRKMVIIGPNEEFTNTSMPRLLMKANVFNDPAIIKRNTVIGTRDIEKEFNSLARVNPNITYVSFFETMCQSDCPKVSSTGDPLNFDDNHLSLSAAIDMVKKAGPSLAFGDR